MASTNKQKLVSNLPPLLKLQRVKETNITVSNNFHFKADLVWSMFESWFYLMKNTWETSNGLRGNPPSLTYLQPGDRFCVGLSSFASCLSLMDPTARQQRCNAAKVNLGVCVTLNINPSIRHSLVYEKKHNKTALFPNQSTKAGLWALWTKIWQCQLECEKHVATFRYKPHACLR